MEAKDTRRSPKFNLAKLIKVCLRHWLLFAACIACCVALAGAYLVWRTPKYEVNAQLMIPPETSSGGIMALTDMASSFNLGDMFGTSSTENEVAVLRSHSVFLQTAKDMGLNTACYARNRVGKMTPLFTKAPLVVTAAPGVADSIALPVVFKLKKLGDGTFDIKAEAKRKTVAKLRGAQLPAVVSTPYGDFTIGTTAAYEKCKSKSFVLTFGSYSGAAQLYAMAVNIYSPSRKTDFITLSLLTTDTEFGKELLNSIIDNYNLLYNEQKNEKSSRSLVFLDKRLESLGAELAQTESDMENFKKEHGLTDVQIDAATAIEKSTKLDEALIYQQMENEILRMTYDFISSPENQYSLIPNVPGGGDQKGGLMPDSEISAYNELIIKHMQLSAGAKAGNAAIMTLEEQINAMRANIAASLQQAIKNSGIRLRDLSSQNSMAKGRIGSIPALERQYIGLERKLVLQQQLYLFLLKQREEAEMNISKVTPSLLTIDDPYVLIQTPGLKPKLVALLALVLGFGAALAYIFLVKLKKAPLWSAGEIEDASEAPVAGELSCDDAGNGLPVLAAGAGGSVRQLRADVQFLLDTCDGKAVMVTSPRHGDGKTYVATNLAAAMALVGKKTVIVDASIGKPGVAAVFGLGNTTGLAQAAQGADLRQCVQTVDLGGASLDVVCAGNPGNSDPSDLASSTLAAKAIAELRREYDCVVIDTPALDDQSTALSLAESADITLVVLRSKHSTPADADQANALYADGRLKRIAIVANC